MSPTPFVIQILLIFCGTLLSAGNRFSTQMLLLWMGGTRLSKREAEERAVSVETGSPARIATTAPAVVRTIPVYRNKVLLVQYQGSHT